MRRPSPLPALLLLVLAAPACRTFTNLSGEQRLQLQQQLTAGPGAERFLRASSYLTPFFGDASKRLLTPYPPEEVRLLNDLEGRPISPGPVQGLIPAGTRVRILEVEFPTAWVVAERILVSPRTQPWVYLEVEGAPPGPPIVLVLSSRSNTPGDFLAELDRYLVDSDMEPRLSRFQARYREAIREKKVIEFMPAAAVEHSWGYPEVIKRSMEGQLVQEEWVYPGGQRRVLITQDQVTKVEEPPAAPEPR